MLARWLIELNLYRITLVHIVGKSNSMADTLSRLERAYPETTVLDLKELDDIADFPVCLVLEGSGAQPLRHSNRTNTGRIMDEQDKDTEVRQLKEFFTTGRAGHLDAALF
uniref:Uncharacterized protein n=1 Tax=Ditylenchus dipsaci TaxID=166011 RepID=A0A915EFV2_9BILA